jgi:hypothetical protein
MSGLFHRLAAQALGKAQPVVHSLAHIPYVAPLELVDESAAEGTPAPPEMPAPLGNLGRDARIDGAPRPLDPGFPLVLQPPTPVLSAQTVRSEDRASAEPTRAPLLATSSRRLPPADLPADGRPLQPVAGIPTALLPVQTREGVAPAPAGTVEPRAAEPAAPSPRLAPAPLLSPSPLAWPRSNASGRSPLVRPLEVANAQQDETTEVHVHIGRIEVTALHEAPPPKPKRPPARSPMSLDDYLARRKEERR